MDRERGARGHDLSDRRGAPRPLDRSGRVARIFPVASPATLEGHPVLRALLLTSLAVIGTLVGVLHVPGRSRGVVWAEDGVVFIAEALRLGPATLVRPYAGYLHTVPRIESLLVLLGPLREAALVVLVLSSVTAALCAVAVFAFAEHRIRSVPLRLAVWLSAIALPSTFGEVAGDLANLHWYLVVAAVWAVLARARSRAVLAIQCLVIASAVLSDPVALVCAPFLALRWVLTRRRGDALLAIVGIVAALLQSAGMLTARLSEGTRTTHPPRWDPGAVADWLSTHLVTPTVLGISPAQAVARVSPVAAMLVPLLVVVALLAVGLTRRGADRWAIGLLIAGALVFEAALLTVSWDLLGLLRGFEYWKGGRYLVVPCALLTGACLGAVDAIASDGARRLRVGAGLAALVWLAVLSSVDLRTIDVRAGGPEWSAGVDAAARECRIGNARTVSVGIAPDFLGSVPVPCADLGP